MRSLCLALTNVPKFLERQLGFELSVLTLFALRYGTLKCSDPCRGTRQWTPISANCIRERKGGGIAEQTDAFAHLILTYIMPNTSSRGIMNST